MADRTGRRRPTILLEVAGFCLLLLVQAEACLNSTASESFTVGFNSSNGSLQAALEMASSLTADCIELYLLPGTHVLSRRVTVRKSLHLQLHPDYASGSFSAIVTCNSSSIVAPTSAGNETEELAVLSVLGALSSSIRGLVFENCSLPIQFVGVDNLTIANSTFRNLTPGGAVNVYNCSSVEVYDSTFLSNSNQGLFQDKPNRANGGGLSIGVHNVFRSFLGSTPPRYEVRDCVFENNSALSNLTVQRSSTGITTSRVFNGRGGGIAFIISHPTALDILIHRSFFRKNFARNFAGGLYFFVADSTMEGSYNISDSTFVENEALVGGGAVGMGLATDGSPGRENRVALSNLTLDRNKAVFGGGLYIIPGITGSVGNLVTMKKCKLIGNMATDYGAAVAVASLQGYLIQSLLRETVFIDNEFIGNVGSSGGVLSTYYFPLDLRGVNRFFNNTGTSLRVVSARVNVEGRVEFSSNQDIQGAAVYLSSYAQLMLFSGSQLDFTDNVGTVGAAIEVEPLYTEPFLVSVPDNPQCFLIYETPNVLQDDWNVTITFRRNRAEIGAAIFTREVGLCSFNSYKPPFFDHSRSFRTEPFKYFDNVNAQQDPANDTRFSVSTPIQNFSVQHVGREARGGEPVRVFPGEVFKVAVNGWDELGNPTQGVYGITEDEEESEDEYSLKFNPSSISVFPRDEAVDMKFGSSLQEFDEDQHSVLFLHERTSRTDIYARGELHITPQVCPPGMVFRLASASLYVCGCDTENEDVLSCEPNGRDVILRRGRWGTSFLKPEKLSHALSTLTCPPGHCRCSLDTVQNDSLCHFVFRHLDRDYQCQCFREGVLCGSCGNGTSVSALLDKCVQCTDVNSIVIAVLVLADAAVILTVMILSLWKPLNMPTWLYPFLFFLQVVPLAAKSFPITFEQFQAPLAYIGSLSGLYFPYDFCLYSGATALESYALRYVPFILALVLCPAVLLIARAARVKVNFSGVWFIQQLLFNQVVYTSVVVLNCAWLPDSRGVLTNVWYYDGNVQCFSGGHAALGVWAVACLLLLLIISLAPLLIVVRRSIVAPQWRSVRDAATYVYRERYFWFYVVDLARRFIIITVMVSTPATMSGVLFLLSGFYMWYAYTKPYKYRAVNYLEMVLMADFIVILFLLQYGFGSPYIEELETLRSRGSRNACGQPEYYPTGRASIIAAFYFLPVLVPPTVLAWWIAVKLRSCKRKPVQKDRAAGEDDLALKSYVRRKDTVIINNVIDLDIVFDSGPQDYSISGDEEKP